jgi:hypothetical protein
MEVLSAWTDALNIALVPLGLSLQGENASRILAVSSAGHVLASRRAATDNECGHITAEANARLEIDRVTSPHIAEAIAYTLWRWAE